jgi:hypothetical protein
LDDARDSLSLDACSSILGGMKKLLVASAIACMASGLVGQIPGFKAPVYYPVTDLGFLDAIDLDGDGDLDLTRTTGQQLGRRAMINSGTGVFGDNPPFLPVGCDPGPVVNCDFNGDGQPDALIGDGNCEVLWVVNAGPGQWTNYYCAGAPCLNYYLLDQRMICDIDGDGADELFNESGFWQWSNGAAAFTPWAQLLSLPMGEHIIAIADIDNDGHADLVTSLGSWLRNSGNGNFANVGTISGWALGYMGLKQVAFHDLDGDGDIDMYFCKDDFPSAGTDTGLGIMLNDGSGQFSLAYTLPVGSGFHMSWLPIDAEGDGDTDFVGGNITMLQCVQQHSGSFSLLQAPIYSHTGASAGRLTIGDLDSDGYEDIAFATYSVSSQPSVAVLLNASLAAQSEPFGTGCGTTPLNLQTNARPLVGSNVNATITNTPTQLSVVSLGFSNTVMGTSPLPLDLTIAGMPGCMLHQSSEAFGLPANFAGIPFEMVFTLSVPSNVTLVGQHVYAQAFSFAPFANPLEVISSNGIDFLIGNQ